MIKSKKICEIDGCNFPVFSHKKCYFHSQKKSLKKSNKPIKKISEKGLEKRKEKKEYTEKQWEFFLEIWSRREHICFETGKYLGETPLSTMFHHCLYKSLYKEFALEDWNIVLLHPDVHNQVHSDSTKTPKVQEYTKQLKEKYGR